VRAARSSISTLRLARRRQEREREREKEERKYLAADLLAISHRVVSRFEKLAVLITAINSVPLLRWTRDGEFVNELADAGGSSRWQSKKRVSGEPHVEESVLKRALRTVTGDTRPPRDKYQSSEMLSLLADILQGNFSATEPVG